jgi:CheY-like chemotaxis protein
VEASRPLIDARQHDLRIALPDMPVTVRGDHARLVQMITNLLNNAAKYTAPRGHLSLHMEVHDGAVAIRVQDDGDGIDATTLPHIFDLFVRGERAPQQGQDGLGVGLTLVRQIAEHHGGAVRARSAGLGCGSEFVVTLPRTDESAGDVADTPDMPVAATRRIVIVDDNRDAALSLGALLRLAGHHVEEAHDGASGIEVVLAQRPDVVLLDIGLPDLDGHEVARRLRARDCHAVLVAVTGYGAPEDVDRSRKSGFDHHLVKPVDPVALERLLATTHAAA